MLIFDKLVSDSQKRGWFTLLEGVNQTLAQSGNGNPEMQISGSRRQTGQVNLSKRRTTADQPNYFCPRKRVDIQNILKGLILAQNERWRHGLGMQVAGIQQWGTGVRGSKAWVPTSGFGIATRNGG